jgi:hypothetical protein
MSSKYIINNKVDWMNNTKSRKINNWMTVIISVTLLSCVNVNAIQLLPERDIVTPQHRNYTLYILPEISYTSIMAESMDYSLSYNYLQNSSHAWVIFSIPEGMTITYQYKVFIYLLNSYGDTISNDTFIFIIAANLSDDTIWDLWNKYDEYVAIIDNQSGIIADQNETIAGFDREPYVETPFSERALPVVTNLLLISTGALGVSFVAFLGITKMKKQYKELKGTHGKLQDNFRSEMEQNRTGSLSLFATKVAGDARPIPIIELEEERGAVKMLRDDPQLSDFLQVIESNDEKSSLDHLKNLFKTDKYASVYNDKLSYQCHCLNALLRYCENYGFTGEEETLYPKGCLLKDIEEYRDEIHSQIKQYSLAGSYVPASQEESQLRAKVKGTFNKMPDPPKL